MHKIINENTSYQSTKISNTVTHITNVNSRSGKQIYTIYII